jgi:transcriptional regulator with XRE-family HTH domain
MQEQTGPDEGAFATKLDRLFRTVRPAGGSREFSYREVARGIEQRGDVTISASYLHQLRTGAKDNPTIKHLEAIASFFGVPASYFLDEQVAAEVSAELKLLSAMRDVGVRDVAMRAHGLSKESLSVVADMIERTRELEGLDSPSTKRRTFKPGQSRTRRGGNAEEADPHER